MAKPNETLLERGARVISDYVKTLPDKPGVYRMINDKEQVVYVGKAKSLKKRVVSYSYVDKLSTRIKRMVAETVQMHFIVTHTEIEALLLEATLIKKLKPHYNILLKDDKSFPYILLTTKHDFPQIMRHRGAQKVEGRYFGPYASAGAVYSTVNTVLKAFRLRNCKDSMFANRKRPCLQYHIKRCTAPCVGYVSKQDYAEQVMETTDFLSGKSAEIIKRYGVEMEAASDALEFEKAAELRDRIRALSYVQSHLEVNLDGMTDADVWGVSSMGGMACLQVFFFRGGHSLGNRPYFVKQEEGVSEDEMMEQFLMQFYEDKPIPKLLYTSIKLSQASLIGAALSEKSEHRVTLEAPTRGSKYKTIQWVARNATETLNRYLAEEATQRDLLEKLAACFDLEQDLKRIEIYDNSHIAGTDMVGAMVVAGVEGFHKKAYRKFNIKAAIASDDFGMMREVMRRRFSKLVKDQDEGIVTDWPDLVLLDGGKGQLSSAKEVLEELGLWDDLNVIAISKGPDRNAGREEFHMEGRTSFRLTPNDPVLFYLQRLRDEAHRFAITTHRDKRAKGIERSPLDDLPGIGAKRKKALLMHFGSAKAVKQAGIKDLQNVDGISQALAETIYNFFH